MSQISLVSDGFKLAGNLFFTEQPKKLAFLFIQGWTGHQNIEAAQILTKLGYTTYDIFARYWPKHPGPLVFPSISLSHPW